MKFKWIIKLIKKNLCLCNLLKNINIINIKNLIKKKINMKFKYDIINEIAIEIKNNDLKS